MPPLTPLVRPETYFAERHRNGLRVLIVVGAVVLSSLALWYGTGWIITNRIDGTVTTDNPDRPPDMFCENDLDVGHQAGCDQPRTIEKDVDSLLWDAWATAAGHLLVGLTISWLLFGILLHAGSWLAGGENGVLPSFGVAAWGLVPSLASAIVTVVVLYFTVDPITVTPANQDTVLETVKSSYRGLQSYRGILTLVTSAWTAVIWRYGLESRQGISSLAVWTVGGSVAALFSVVVLV